MDKVDIFIGALGIASYFAIMMDLRSYERKVAMFEAIQDKRRKYAELQAERRKAELAMENSIKEKVEKKLTMGEDLKSSNVSS